MTLDYGALAGLQGPAAEDREAGEEEGSRERLGLEGYSSRLGALDGCWKNAVLGTF